MKKPRLTQPGLFSADI